MRKLTKSTIQRDKKKQKTTDQENESLCNQNNTQESLLQPNRLFDNAQPSLEPAVGGPAFGPTCLNLIWPAVKDCTVDLWFVLQKHLLICLGMQFKVPKIKKMPNIYEIENDKVVGFENEAATIIKKLIQGSKEKEVVLITGMGGLGKTTLAKRVYEEKSVVNHFHKHAWCTVSQEYNCEDLLNKIYNQVCGKETKKDSIAEKLRKSLMGRRYLIVLDDIWSLKAWEELNRAFPSCDKGSRVVLTSRQESIVSDAKHICLPFFTVDESRELLQVKLFKGKECPKELENIGKQISKECGGLPL